MERDLLRKGAAAERASGDIFSKKRNVAANDAKSAATDLIEYAKTHLPILLGTQVTVFRSQIPRPANRIH
jgi:hypothetical protein